MSDKCTIFVGGDAVSPDTLDTEFLADSVVYGADKGFYLAHSLGIKCDVVLGDFDSSKKPKRDDVLLFPVEKDDTDLMLAIRHAFDNGLKDFQVYGAMGGSADHLIGNIQALGYIVSHDGSAVIIGDNDRITLLPAGKYSFKKREGYQLSLFAYSERVTGLSLSGVKYHAQNITLENTFPLGMSNHIEADNAEVSFSSGLLLVIESKR